MQIDNNRKLSSAVVPHQESDTMSYSRFFYYPDEEKAKKATENKSIADAENGKGTEKDAAPKKIEYENAFYRGNQPKPTRLREMNLWAPTSM